MVFSFLFGILVKARLIQGPLNNQTTNRRETGEPSPVWNAESYPHKWRAEIGMLRSCSQLFGYIQVMIDKSLRWGVYFLALRIDFLTSQNHKAILIPTKYLAG